jgi:patatin-like phospholipase/acyl hydrolase
VTGPKLLVPAYCQSQPGTIFFKSWEATPDFLLRDVARCTSAAETYFPAAVIKDSDGTQYICTDGGTFANNPTMAILSDAQKLWPKDEFQILSLGTGGNTKPLGAECVNWGTLQWATRIANVFMDGAADTVSYYLSAVPDVTLTRIEIDLPDTVDPAMDEASPENIAALRAVGTSLIAVHNAALDSFAKRIP